jgi:PAS domain S-box-containing protein
MLTLLEKAGTVRASAVSNRPVRILSGLLVVSGLYLTSRYNYLLFHSLAEIFSIVVAGGIFMVAWNSRRFLDNHYFLFLGIAYLYLAGIDLLHTLAYSGLGVFPGHGANLSTQFWIAARYLEALSLLVAPFFIGRKLRTDLVFFAYALVFALVLISIFYWHSFPLCYIEGNGLTLFKKISEYVISLILLAALGLLWQRRNAFDQSVLTLLGLSILLTVASELAFTFYVSVYGLSNLIGHFLKIISFYLIYKAIIQTGLVKPYTLLFRNLKQNAEMLQESEERYRSLFNGMISGFALHEVVADQISDPREFRVLGVNPAFEVLTGLHRNKVVGKSLHEILPQTGPGWARTYSEVARTGKRIRLENYAQELDKYFEILAFRPQKGQVAVNFTDITERKRAEAALQRSRDKLEMRVRERTAELLEANAALQETETRYRTIFETVPVSIWEEEFSGVQAEIDRLKRQGVKKFRRYFKDHPDVVAKAVQTVRILGVNDQTLKMFGAQDKQELMGSLNKVFMPETLETFAEEMAALAEGRDHFESESVVRTLDGQRRHILLTISFPDQQLPFNSTLVSIMDITERKRAEESLRRAHRALTALSHCNQELVRATEESGLVKAMCRIIVEVAGYPLAWVGYAERDHKGVVQPAGGWGCAAGSLDSVEITQAQAEQGPVGDAMHTGKPSVARHILTDSRHENRREEAAKGGYASGIALPLLVGENSLGVLNIYAKEPDAFDGEEVQLLKELADDLAYGIDSLRTRAEKARAAEALRKSEMQLRRLSSQLLATQEKERKHLAQELHDSIGASLAAIKFGAERALAELPEASASAARGSVKHIIPTVHATIEEVRRIQRALRPPILDDLGILATIGWFCREFQEIYSTIRIDPRLDVQEDEIPEAIKIVIFRIIQEALNNAAKYSRADLVRIMISQTDRLELMIEDNGVGFDLNAVLSREGAERGLGLIGMKERTELAGGVFSIETVEGGGTTIRASWPNPPHQKAKGR